MVVRAVRADRVSHVHQRLRQRLRVLLDLHAVLLELGRRHLLQLRRDGRDLVIVRTALQTGEHRVVDLALEVALVLAEEDHAGARTAQRLVRRRRHNIAVLERVRRFARRHQTADVRHVHHHDRTARVRHLANPSVIPLTRIRRSSANDHLRSVDSSNLLHEIVVHETRLRIHVVRKRLEEDRRTRQSLPSVRLRVVRVVTVSQMASRRKIQTHHAATRSQQTRVHSQVARRSGIGLNVHAPLFRIQMISSQSTLLAQLFDLVDVLVASVITMTRISLRVFVRQTRTQALHNSSGSEVLFLSEGYCKDTSEAIISNDFQDRFFSFSIKSKSSGSCSSRGTRPGYGVIQLKNLCTIVAKPALATGYM